MEYLILAIGFCGMLAGFLALQCKRHYRALLLKTADEGLFALQYLLLGAATGAVLNSVGILRHLTFSYLGYRDDQRRLRVARYLFCALFAVLGALAWEGYISLLIITAKVTSTYAYGTTNMRLLRILLCFTSSCWICYNLYAGSLMGMVSDLVNLSSAVIGLIRFEVLPRKRRGNR